MSPKKEGENNAKTKKPSYHDSKSRHDGLAGEMKPAENHTVTPKDEGTGEPSPGTSGSSKDTEIYRSTGKAMILSPEGKLIPFRMLDKVQKATKNEKRRKRLLILINTNISCKKRENIYNII